MAFRIGGTSLEAPIRIIRRNQLAIALTSLIVGACLGSSESPHAGSAGTAGSGSKSGGAGKGSSTTGGQAGSGWGTGNGGGTVDVSGSGGTFAPGGGSGGWQGGAGAPGGNGGAPGSTGGATGAAGAPGNRAGGAGAPGRAGGAGAPNTGGGSTPDGGAGASAEAGAPVPFIDTARIFRWMATDIAAMRDTDRGFQRYLSLAHLRNAGASDRDMDLYRAAMVKGLNALSQGTRIAVPRAIDPYATIYRVDTRELEWDAQAAIGRTDKWEALVAGNPYAIEYLEDDAEVVKTFSRSRVPLQSGNWVVFAGMQPPLYHTVASIPLRLSDLERRLGVDIRNDIAREQVQRSAFAHSSVAQQNRVIERHDTSAGADHAMWITYDFAGVAGRRNVFSHPLDFQHDASEIIFSLPNGLFGYMIVDGSGNRQDSADLNVEKDISQRNGLLTNGISCIGCHDQGIQFKKDEVRDFVQASFEFDAAEKDLVAGLYVPSSDFQSVVTQDSNAFLQQLRFMAIPATLAKEPVSAVFHLFEEDVDLNHAAAELGFTGRQLLSQLGRLNQDLAPLATGSIKRDVFRARFAQTVCLLNLGLANDAACRR